MKKTWVPPELTIHGNVEKITQQDKTLGLTDGFTFQGQPIRNSS